MKNSRLVSSALGALLALGALNQTQTAAKADTTSTAAIAAGAAAIVGALLYDGNRQPYYVRDNRHYYVSQSEANYYRAHHHVSQRNVYVAQPVNRNRYYGNPRNDRGNGHASGHGNGHGQGQHGDQGHNHR